jgi:5-formyltetrahydrofolate cyclo-ligase
MIDKLAVRALARVRRAGLTGAQRERLSAALVASAGAVSALAPVGTISGFLSIGDEIDIMPLMQALAQRGHTLALPVMQGRGQPLLFRRYSPGDALAVANWGIQEPLAAAAPVQPDLLLVPMLAFDASGHRLGYGGGFYDRSLAQLRMSGKVTAVGVAFDEQRLDAVPHLDYDQKLDGVLTPTGLTMIG